MVVMQIVPNLDVGGVETSVISLCAALSKRGINVVLVSLGAENALDSELRKHPELTVSCLGLTRHSIVLFPLFIWSVARIVRSLAAIMRHHEVDVVQGHMASASLLGALSAMLAGVPKRFATFHSILFLPRQSRMDVRNRMMLSTLRRLAFVFERYIAVSSSVRNALVEHGIDSDRVIVVPNGVEPADFEPVDPDGLVSLKNSLGLGDGERVVACVGTLREAKGQRYLIEAASQLSDEFPDVVYLLVGEGSCRRALEELVSELHVGRTVRLLGSRHDVAAILSLSHVFVLPSLWEGLPVALLEAMAMGLPCVATRVSGNVELLRDGESGLLVDPQDSRQLAHGIRELLLHPARASTLGQNARTTVRQRYSMDGMTTRLLDIYGS